MGSDLLGLVRFSNQSICTCNALSLIKGIHLWHSFRRDSKRLELALELYGLWAFICRQD
jgi:hypothetical protein